MTICESSILTFEFTYSRRCSIFGDPNRLADAWDEITHSPILTQWAWSELVVSGVERNSQLIHPSLEFASDTSPLTGLIALHVRRGDFKGHCKYLEKYHAPFNGFNFHPGFNDQYSLPQDADKKTMDAFFSAHCYPEIPDIVTKVMTVRNTLGENVDRIYIMTNAKTDWLKTLEDALREEAEWASIASSRDLNITREQKYVGQAMDMLIATKAEAFIGNGVTTFIFWLV